MTTKKKSNKKRCVCSDAPPPHKHTADGIELLPPPKNSKRRAAFEADQRNQCADEKAL